MQQDDDLEPQECGKDPRCGGDGECLYHQALDKEAIAWIRAWNKPIFAEAEVKYAEWIAKWRAAEAKRRPKRRSKRTEEALRRTRERTATEPADG